MIGMGWEINNTWNYKNYTVTKLNNDHEPLNIKEHFR